jgi:hypothetical protein
MDAFSSKCGRQRSEVYRKRLMAALSRRTLIIFLHDVNTLGIARYASDESLVSLQRRSDGSVPVVRRRWKGVSTTEKIFRICGVIFPSFNIGTLILVSAIIE